MLRLGLVLASLLATALAPEPGKASGTVTIDGTETRLTYAVRIGRENSFDNLATDAVIVLSDRALSAAEAVHEDALLERANRGELVAMALRFDGRPGRGKLFNVAVFHKGLAEIPLLPDMVFEYTYKGGVGMLSLASREFRGHVYAGRVEFAVAVPIETTAAAPPTTSGFGPLPLPSRSDAERKAATALLIQALMEGDETRSLAIIRLGIDPNGRDDKMGIPVLNWSVLMCQPPVVQALIEARADLQHERSPGMTILAEAVACPEAAKLLRAAGAR